MRAACWRCGEAVTYLPFDKAREVVCPDCGEAIFRPLDQARAVFDVFVAVLGSGAVWLAEVWDVPLWGGLLLLAAVPLGQYLLWPLVRRGLYALWTWHYDATGVAWGRHDLPCWRCGGTVSVYMTRANRDVCPHCRTELFEPVRGKDWALAAAISLIWVGALLLVLLFPAREWTAVQRLSVFILALVLAAMLDIPHGILFRRAYLRYLERYRAGETAPPKSGT